MKKNECFAESDLLEIIKKKIDTSVTYTIYGVNLEYKKGENGGWCVTEMPHEFYGIENILL